MADDLAYLGKVRNRLNKDAAFRKLGSVDVKLALAIGSDLRLVTFEAFELAAIDMLEAEDLRDAELVLRMTKREWNAYLKKRKHGEGPTLLAIDLDKRIIEARDPLADLKLERFNRSLQAFVDTCAKVAA